MDHYLSRIIGSIGTLITAYLVIDFTRLGIGVNSILIGICAYVGVFLGLDAYRAFVEREKSFDRTTEKGRKKIAKYLCSQLTSSGSVAVFSKDLTWVTELPEAESVLNGKAKKGELCLYVEDETDLTRRLSAAGAQLRFYGGQKKKGFSPKSRFTILDVRTGGVRIIVGSPSDGKHCIKRYDKSDFEVVDLAMDFVSLLECTARSAK